MSAKLYTEDNCEYLNRNPTWHAEDSSWKAGLILKMLKKNSINPNSVAELGCGCGEILNQLQLSMPRNVIFTGNDISNDAIFFAKQKAKDRIEFKVGSFSESTERFDLLLIIDVFEHVDDYLGFLKLYKNKAKFTIFHIPLDISVQAILRNKLMYERKQVGHLHYFIKETAIATLIDSGYEIIDCFYTAATIYLPSKSIKSRLAILPRKLLYYTNQDFAAKLLGGFSLLVLTK